MKLNKWRQNDKVEIKWPKHLTQSKGTDINGNANYDIWLYQNENEKQYIKTMENTTYSNVVKEIEILDKGVK